MNKAGIIRDYMIHRKLPHVISSAVLAGSTFKDYIREHPGIDDRTGLSPTRQYRVKRFGEYTPEEKEIELFERTLKDLKRFMADAMPAKPRGRPKKVVIPPTEPIVKKPRGRPKKVVIPPTEPIVKKPRGRPKKVVEPVVEPVVAPVAPKPRGRPKGSKNKPKVEVKVEPILNKKERALLKIKAFKEQPEPTSKAKKKEKPPETTPEPTPQGQAPITELTKQLLEELNTEKNKEDKILNNDPLLKKLYLEYFKRLHSISRDDKYKEIEKLIYKECEKKMDKKNWDCIEITELIRDFFVYDKNLKVFEGNLNYAKQQLEEVRDFFEKHKAKYKGSKIQNKKELEKAYDRLIQYFPEDKVVIRLADFLKPTPQGQAPETPRGRVLLDEEDEKPIQPLPALISDLEKELYSMKIADIRTKYGKLNLPIKGKKEELIKAVLKSMNKPEGVKWANKYPWIYEDLKYAYSCLLPDIESGDLSLSGLKQSKKNLLKYKEKLDNLKQLIKEKIKEGGPDTRREIGNLVYWIEQTEERIKKCRETFKMDFEKRVKEEANKEEKQKKRFEEANKEEPEPHGRVLLDEEIDRLDEEWDQDELNSVLDETSIGKELRVMMEGLIENNIIIYPPELFTTPNTKALLEKLVQTQTIQSINDGILNYIRFINERAKVPDGFDDRGQEDLSYYEMYQKRLKQSTLNKIATQSNRLSKIQARELRMITGSGLSAAKVEYMSKSAYKDTKEVGDIGKFKLDPKLSTDEVKVWVNDVKREVAVSNRGTKGTMDWFNNAAYVSGNYELTPRFQRAKSIQKAVLKKYPKYKIINLGHSQGAVITRKLNDAGLTNEVINVNPAVMPLERKKSNETTVKSSGDVVSIFHRKDDRDVVIPDKTGNVLTEHKTDIVGRLNPKTIIGLGSLFEFVMDK